MLNRGEQKFGKRSVMEGRICLGVDLDMMRGQRLQFSINPTWKIKAENGFPSNGLGRAGEPKNASQDNERFQC